MKTTVFGINGERVTATPSANGETLALGIRLDINGQVARMGKDTAEALIFGLQQALVVMDMRQAVARVMA